LRVAQGEWAEYAKKGLKRAEQLHQKAKELKYF